jgi:hypothetical protein
VIQPASKNKQLERVPYRIAWEITAPNPAAEPEQKERDLSRRCKKGNNP